MTIGATPAHDDDPGAELAQHHDRATLSRTTIEASRLEIRHELDHHRLTPTMRRPGHRITSAVHRDSMGWIRAR